MESSSALVVGKAPFPRQRNVPNNKSTTVGVEICFIWSDPEIGIDDRVPLSGVGARGTPDLRQGWPVYQAATAGNLTMRSSLI
jgi:hypothetical protein